MRQTVSTVAAGAVAVPWLERRGQRGVRLLIEPSEVERYSALTDDGVVVRAGAAG